MNLEISRLILKNNRMSNFIKICHLGAELLHADGRTNGLINGQTDRCDEANSRYLQFRERA